MNKHTRGQRIGCLICVVSAALMVVLTVAVVRYAATHLRPAEDAPDTTCPVVSAAAPKTVDIQGFCAPAKAAPDMTCPVGTVPVLETYTDGDAPVPEWWNPDEPMAAVWEDHSTEAGNMVEGNALQSDTVDYIAHPPVGIAPGGVDWNIETEIVGWDGHTMTGVELDLFSRIAYLEVWGSSEECCKAVVDAILALWDSGYYGNTLFETLSAVTETGWYAFSTYPGMWSVTYDSNGLDEMRTLCMERFTNGYEYDAPFFRTDYYHPWAVDAYHIDNVYFSYSPWTE